MQQPVPTTTTAGAGVGEPVVPPNVGVKSIEICESEVYDPTTGLELNASLFCHRSLANSPAQNYCVEMLHLEEYQEAVRQRTQSAAPPQQQQQPPQKAPSVMSSYLASCGSASPQCIVDKNTGKHYANIVGVDYPVKAADGASVYSSEMNHYDEYVKNKCGGFPPTTRTLKEEWQPVDKGLVFFYNFPKKATSAGSVEIYVKNGIGMTSQNYTFCAEMQHYDDYMEGKGVKDYVPMVTLFGRP